MSLQLRLISKKRSVLTDKRSVTLLRFYYVTIVEE
nr:MAG TPA: hypothetical protein [Bacteriophage sp.]DAX82182.1 MAG TPA: hypothetical protein [Caudoviricetes sp.]